MISAGVSSVHDVIEMSKWTMDLVSSIRKHGSKNADKKELNINEGFIINPQINWSLVHQVKQLKRLVPWKKARRATDASLQERLNFKNKARYVEFQVNTILVYHTNGLQKEIEAQLVQRNLLWVDCRFKEHKGKIPALCQDLRDQTIEDLPRWPEIQHVEQKFLSEAVSQAKQNVKKRKGSKSKELQWFS